MARKWGDDGNMTTTSDLSLQAQRYHEHLPARIRQYLNDRGIPNPIIERYVLGWTGFRISIPIPDRSGRIRLLKLARDPVDAGGSPKMVAHPSGVRAELYGWSNILSGPKRVIICEGEFDRLALEALGFPAVTSTAGAATFLPEWAEALRGIPAVYICFDRDAAGENGALRVARMIPQARIAQLPPEVGDGGDVTDYFVRLGRRREDFEIILENAISLPILSPLESTVSTRYCTELPRHDETNRLKSLLRIEDVVSQYTPLRRSGRNYVARCPFHDDRHPSLVVYPETQSFYCFGCRVHGDSLNFLMKMERLTFREALQVAREL